MLAAIEPGTGRVRALAANRKLQAGRPDEPAEQDLHRPGEGQEEDPGHLPEHHQPAAHRRRRHHRLPGRLGVQDVHHGGGAGEGLPARLHDQREAGRTSRSTSSSTAARRPATGTNYYCPQQRRAQSMAGVHNMWTGFGRSVNTFFVPLQERVGAENVVDVGQAVRHQVPRPERRRLVANNKDAAHQWGAFTLGVSADDPAGDGERVRDPGRRRQVLRADPGAADHRPGRREARRRQAALHAARRQPDVARAAWTRPAARSVTIVAARQLRRQPHRGRRTRHRRHPVFGKTGTTDNDKTAALIVGTKQLAVAGYPGRPGLGRDHQDRMAHDIVNPAVYETLRGRHEGQAARSSSRDPAAARSPYGDQRSIPDVKCATGRRRDVPARKRRLRGLEVGHGRSTRPARPARPPAPARSGRTIKGGFVSIEVSNGKGGEAERAGQTPDDPTATDRTAGRPPGG